MWETVGRAKSNFGAETYRASCMLTKTEMKRLRGKWFYRKTMGSDTEFEVEMYCR